MLRVAILEIQKQFNRQLKSIHFKIRQSNIEGVRRLHQVVVIHVLKIVLSMSQRQFQRTIFFLASPKLFKFLLLSSNFKSKN